MILSAVNTPKQILIFLHRLQTDDSGLNQTKPPVISAKLNLVLLYNNLNYILPLRCCEFYIIVLTVFRKQNEIPSQKELMGNHPVLQQSEDVSVLFIMMILTTLPFSQCSLM